MVALSTLLSPETVRLNVPANSWQEAIQSAGSLLVSHGIAGESYTQKMIENVQKNGPYIVITPGFAFAHSRADDSVQRTGMSLIRLTQPVEFGHEKNDPVNLVLALAAEDDTTHQQALAQLAKVLSNPAKRRRLDEAQTEHELLAVFEDDAHTPSDPASTASVIPATEEPADTARDASKNKNFVLTVCGNGLGTSLFLKNTLEQVLDYWGWGSYLTVEATDTISARGRANEADFIMTSGEIAKTLGEVNIPVKVIQDFTSQQEIDAALRDLYDV